MNLKIHPQGASSKQAAAGYDKGTLSETYFRMIRDHAILADVDTVLEAKLIGDFALRALAQPHFFTRFLSPGTMYGAEKLLRPGAGGKTMVSHDSSFVFLHN